MENSIILTSALLQKKGFNYLPDKDNTYCLEIRDPDQIYRIYQAVGLANDSSWGIRESLIIQCNEDFSHGILFDGVDLYSLDPDDFEELILWL